MNSAFASDMMASTPDEGDRPRRPPASSNKQIILSSAYQSHQHRSKTMRLCAWLVPENGAAIPYATIAQHAASLCEHVLRMALMPIVRRYGQNGNDTDAAVEDHGTRLSLALRIVFERRDITVVFNRFTRASSGHSTSSNYAPIVSR